MNALEDKGEKAVLATDIGVRGSGHDGASTGHDVA